MKLRVYILMQFDNPQEAFLHEEDANTEASKRNRASAMDYHRNAYHVRGVDMSLDLEALVVTNSVLGDD